jgi:hypothetical protein
MRRHVDDISKRKGVAAIHVAIEMEVVGHARHAEALGRICDPRRRRQMIVSIQSGRHSRVIFAAVFSGLVAFIVGLHVGAAEVRIRLQADCGQELLYFDPAPPVELSSRNCRMPPQLYKSQE